MTDIRESVDRLLACRELDVDPSALPVAATRLGDSAVLDLLGDVSSLINAAERLQSVLAGIAAERSRRELGHSGLAAVRGHSTPTALVQSITGGTRADAARQLRVGAALLDGVGADAGPPGPDGGDGSAEAGAGVGGAGCWHDPLRRAVLAGALTTAQHDAIRSGLGEPPTAGGLGAGSPDAGAPDRMGDATTAADEDCAIVWGLAAESLIAEASSLSAEDLVKRARTVRDLLDPRGAEDRYARRFDARSYRMWIDGNGQHRGSIVFDDEMALWVRTLRDAALRARRGGPRFVSDDERSAADDLLADSRTGEQLEYDLLMDVLRAGSLARASEVFGARQPGVRMVVVKDAIGPRDAFGRLLATGHAEDGGDPLPGSVIDRALCQHGSRDVTVDRNGTPLDLGRELRLYSSAQRVALVARDGGCVWPGCNRPPSYCEAHHIDHFAEGGRTDLDRGVLLCRFHHMLLHNNGWRILRDRRGPFMLHPPGDRAPIALESKAAWRWAWDPPPALSRPGWRSSPPTPVPPREPDQLETGLPASDSHHARDRDTAPAR